MATNKIGFQQDWYYGDEEEKGGVFGSIIYRRTLWPIQTEQRLYCRILRIEVGT